LRSADNRRILRAQRQAFDVLATALGLPGAGSFGRAHRSPTVDDTLLGDVAATVVHPAVPPPWPSLVFANGATPDGRAHPIVGRLGVALGRSGYAVYIPDLPGVARGELSPATLAAASACARDVADRAETRDGRVGLVGVSVGGTLALLVAADPTLAARVSAVSCVAPFSDLEKVILLATTGLYRGSGGGLRRYPVPAALAVGLAGSLAGMLAENDPDAETFGRDLRDLDVDSPDPLAVLRGPPARRLGPAATAIRNLLANRGAARFDELFGALPDEIRATVRSLSPVCSAAGITAPVEIATAPEDRYFPVDESLALAVNPRVRLTVTPMLAHARPRLDPRDLSGLVRLDRFFVRSLLAASSHQTMSSAATVRR
jgi:alpha-beta hydrolase superfamily lysophospholipase